ncbi:hypothetical protein DFQ28_002888 [Apophysomyces sp. BC1034]|nr:hypothetical protein DFQ30_002979 [Apophysomyces sp. BC1015]KAG0189788.1 hypothetical protein DFQ28_002888 [Apophysomyces sp. BC1034]
MGARRNKDKMPRRLERISRDLDRLEHELDDKRVLAQVKMTFQQTCQKGSTFRVGRVQDLYNQIVPTLRQITAKYPHTYARAAGISKQLVALEVIPEAWKQTQFWHVSNFPREACTTCGRIVCLQCGEVDHPDQTCLGHLRSQLQSGSEPAEKQATLEWKLDHT